MCPFYDLSYQSNKGETVSMSEYEGKVVLIVNTASNCGFTPQYKELQAMYERNHENGLEIIGFPCNQFGAQEPGTDEEIQGFCELNYGVNFPLSKKVDVNGENAHEVFQFLCKEKPGLLGTKAIKWNFTKFLIDGEGKVLARYAPKDTPQKIEQEVQRLLA